MKTSLLSPIRLALVFTVGLGSLAGLACAAEDDLGEDPDLELRFAFDPASVNIAAYNPSTGKVGKINTAVLRKKRPDGTPIDGFGVQVTDASFFLERHYTSDGHSHIEYFRLEPNGNALSLVATDSWGPLDGVDCGYCNSESTEECYPCRNVANWNILCACDLPGGGCYGGVELKLGAADILQTESL